MHTLNGYFFPTTNLIKIRENMSRIVWWSIMIRIFTFARRKVGETKGYARQYGEKPLTCRSRRLLLTRIHFSFCGQVSFTRRFGCEMRSRFKISANPHCKIAPPWISPIITAHPCHRHPCPLPRRAIIIPFSLSQRPNKFKFSYIRIYDLLSKVQKKMDEGKGDRPLAILLGVGVPPPPIFMNT